MEGNIKIELFDAVTGEKEKEQNDNNFIAKGVYKAIEERARGIFVRFRGTTSSNSDVYSFEDLFEVLKLTDDASAEDPLNEWFLKGNVIGDASSKELTTRPGPAGGKLNLAESYIGGEKVKLVFDFSTDRANGTIKSIGFEQRERVTFSQSIEIYKKEFTTRPNKIIQKETGGFWVLADNVLYSTDHNFKTLKSVAAPATTHDMAFCGGYIILSGSSSSSFYALKENNFEADSFVKITAPYTSYGIATYQSQLMSYKEPGKLVLWTYDEVSGVVVKGEKESSVGSASLRPFVVLDNRFLSISSTLYSDLEKNEGFRKELYSSMVVVGELGEYLLITTSSNGKDFYMVPKINMGSRSLLSEPVTKTDKQTMKITYEFILPPLYQ